MNNYRMLLLSCVAVSSVFLGGFKKVDEHNTTVLKKHKNPKTTQTLVHKKNHHIVDNKREKQKPMDLSIPFKDFESTGFADEKNASTQQLTNLFDPDNKTRTESLQLNGNLLMSPEPEVEKRKSVDGAGIVINLKN